MKIEKTSNSNYKIVIFKMINDNVFSFVEKLIINFKNKLNLHGFYKVLVTSNNFGVFIELIKIDDSYYKDTLNLKISNGDSDIYFKTDDYFSLDDKNKTWYYDGYYYSLVDDSYNELIKMADFGNFVFGEDIFKLLEQAVEI